MANTKSSVIKIIVDDFKRDYNSASDDKNNITAIHQYKRIESQTEVFSCK